MRKHGHNAATCLRLHHGQGPGRDRKRASPASLSSCSRWKSPGPRMIPILSRSTEKSTSGRKSRSSSVELRSFRVPAVKAIANVPKCPNLGHLPPSPPGSRSSNFDFRPFRVPAVKPIANVPKCPNLGHLPPSPPGSRNSSFDFRSFRVPAVKAIANVPKCPNLGHLPAPPPGSRSSSFELRPFRVPAVSAVQYESLRRRIAVYPVLVQYDTGIDAACVGNGEMTNRVISYGKTTHPSRRTLAMAPSACIRP